MGHYSLQCKAGCSQAHFYTDHDEDYNEDIADREFESLFVAMFDQVKNLPLNQASKNMMKFEWIENTGSRRLN